MIKKLKQKHAEWLTSLIRLVTLGATLGGLTIMLAVDLGANTNVVFFVLAAMAVLL